MPWLLVAPSLLGDAFVRKRCGMLVCHYLCCMWLEYNFVWLLWLCMFCVVSRVQPQEFCREPVGEGNFTITSDREVAAGVLHSMFTKRLQFHLKRKEFHSCSAHDYTATRLFQRCNGATEYCQCTRSSRSHKGRTKALNWTIFTGDEGSAA